jgi:hypothetical protein
MACLICAIGTRNSASSGVVITANSGLALTDEFGGAATGDRALSQTRPAMMNLPPADLMVARLWSEDAAGQDAGTGIPFLGWISLKPSTWCVTLGATW